ncbi:MAG: hypothetical protein UU89_C0012G0003 [Parcubacteria group bacterium GW2011_GWC2_42_11]|nr:MAG: hypothetical protein UU89_C0012G0003 [Parcubacteria group bacterium GW2011_GWC2_42_11]
MISNSGWIENEDECKTVIEKYQKEQSEIRKMIASMIIEADKDGKRFNFPSHNIEDFSDMRRIVVDGKYIVEFCLYSIEHPENDLIILGIYPISTDISI